MSGSTYAVRFTDPGYDESDFAAVVARHMGTVHHVVTADDAALLRALDTVTDRVAEPIGDPAVLPTYLLAEAAREHVKVVLSGEGADELFGGYPTHLGHRVAARFGAFPAPLRRAIAGLVARLPASTGKVTVEFLLKRFVAAAQQQPLERHLSWFGALGPPAALAIAEEPARRSADPLNRILWLDFLTYLPDNLLVKVDRATMLASIEARAPFLDRAVLELALPAPSRIKVQRFRTKAILKEAARGVVPAEVIDRRKRGLSVPVARWLNGTLAGVVDRYLARRGWWRANGWRRSWRSTGRAPGTTPGPCGRCWRPSAGRNAGTWRSPHAESRRRPRPDAGVHPVAEPAAAHDGRGGRAARLRGQAGR
jgi:asparagine synthase (glutamine-hydrolysing)